MTDKHACDLFHRCLNECGDESWYQFQQLYGRYLKRVVCRTVRRHHGRLQEDEVEELTQELLYRVLAGRRPRVLGWSDRQLWAYLSQVTSRLLVDRHRLSQRKRRYFASVRGGVGLEWLTDQLRADTWPTPEDLVLRHDGWRQLGNLAAQVVRPDRRSLEMRGLRMALLEGYSSREIAQITGGRLTCRRVDRLVFRLRKKLSAAGLGLPPRRFTSREDVRRSPRQSSRTPRRHMKERHMN